MKLGRVAILMATYNGERFLREQLNSILGQTFGSFTLYIRDDGSTDGTMTLLTEYAARDSRVRIVSDEVRHRGCGESFKYLASVADADYYLFSDQDDVWLSDKVIRSLGLLADNEREGEPLVVHTDLEVVDKDLNRLHPSFFRYTHREPAKASDLNYACAYPTITGCTAVFNRRARDLFIATPATHCLHDQLLGLVTVANGGRVIALNEPTVRYRQHGRNVLGATAERSLIGKIGRLRDSWRDNAAWYRDVRNIVGMSMPRFVVNKIRFALARVNKQQEQ